MTAETPHRITDPRTPKMPSVKPSDAEQEARIAQRDREPVPPAQRLEQLAFLDDWLWPSHPLPELCAHARLPQCEVYLAADGDPYTSWYKGGSDRSCRSLRVERSACAGSMRPAIAAQAVERGRRPGGPARARPSCSPRCRCASIRAPSGWRSTARSTPASPLIIANMLMLPPYPLTIMLAPRVRRRCRTRRISTRSARRRSARRRSASRPSCCGSRAGAR